MKKKLPNIEIRKIAILVEVLGISSDKHRIDEYIIASIYIPDKTRNSSAIIAKITPRKIYLIDSLRAKILISIDIITLEGSNILASKRVLRFKANIINNTLKIEC